MKKTKIKNKFWNFAETEEERVLYISGEIVDGYDEDGYNEGIKSTADIFRDELYSGEGNISVWVNSPGGDMVTGAQIYNLIKKYRLERRNRIISYLHYTKKLRWKTK